MGPGITALPARATFRVRARLLAAADVLAAMTEARPHRLVHTRPTMPRERCKTRPWLAGWIRRRRRR